MSKLRFTAEMLASGPIILILSDQVTTQVVTSRLDLGKGKPKIRILRSDAGRDWGQEEKGTTEDEMAGWHH